MDTENEILNGMRSLVDQYRDIRGRAPQVGVMGSAADLGYSQKVAGYADRIGAILGQTGTTVIFGAEKDCDSLSTTVARAARKIGGLTVGITYGTGTVIYDPTAASVVMSMLGERGGPREAVVSKGACDGIISIGGGSGTLNELVAAYQTAPTIPLIGLENTGGTTEMFLGKKFDTRAGRPMLEPASSPEEAVGLILRRILDVVKTGRPYYPTYDLNMLFGTKQRTGNQ